MTRRSPARLLAPLALASFALVLIIVVSSGGGGDSGSVNGPENRPAATSTPTSESEREGGSSESRRRTYTVKSGDTPSSIAEKTGVPLERLLELNPDVDPQLLSPGQRLKLR